MFGYKNNLFLFSEMRHKYLDPDHSGGRKHLTAGECTSYYKFKTNDIPVKFRGVIDALYSKYLTTTEEVKFDNFIDWSKFKYV